MNPKQPDPVSCPSEVDRKVLCHFYNSCLEITLRNGWPGFSCSECRAFEFEHPEDPDWWAAQGEKSRELLMNAGLFPRWIVERYRARRQEKSSPADEKRDPEFQLQ